MMIKSSKTRSPEYERRERGDTREKRGGVSSSFYLWTHFSEEKREENPMAKILNHILTAVIFCRQEKKKRGWKEIDR